MHSHIVNRAPTNPRRSGARKYQTHQELQRGGLARAVRPQKPEGFAFLDLKSQIVERAAHPLTPEPNGVVLGESLDLDCGRTHGLVILIFF